MLHYTFPHLMLPQFPNFKKLELTDKADVEAHTSKYSPYSDFNFVSMWSWDVNGEMRISELNGNLVVRFNDYLTGEPFYSFLGTNDVNNTAGKLLDLTSKEGLGDKLKLVIEDSIKVMDTNIFQIKEDRDNFDYIYDLEQLKDYSHSKLRRKRNQTISFLRDYPHTEIKIIDLKLLENQEKILKLFDSWIDRKKEDLKFMVEQNKERLVLRKLFSEPQIFNLMGVGLYVDNNLSGFFVNELCDSNYVFGFIAKANIDMTGIYAYLRMKNAEILCKMGKKYMNDEQDLGIDNLRQAKMQFRPVSLLKQYEVGNI